MHNRGFRVIPGEINEENWDEIIRTSGEKSGKSVKESLRSQDKRKKKIRK